MLPPGSRARLATIAAMLAVLTAACTGGADEQTATASSAASATSAPQAADAATSAAPRDADAFPVTLTNRLGEVTIPQAPERVVALGINDIDTVYGLGLTPVGIATYTLTGGLAPWLQDDVEIGDTELLDVTTEVPFEAIAALEPDVILASPLAVIDDAYDTLSEIAPVVADTEGVLTDSWQERTLKVGQALGMTDAAQALVDEAEGAVTAVAEAHPGLDGKTYSMAWLQEPGTIQAMAAEDVTSRLFAQIGLSIAPALLEQQTNSSGGSGTGGAVLSMEQVDLLDADVMIVAFNSDEDREAFESDPLVQAIPAVEDGRYLGVPVTVIGGFRVPTVRNIDWLFEQIEPALAAAG